MASDDAAWVILRHITGAGVDKGMAWHTYRWQAVRVARPPSGSQPMTARCPWCNWRHHFLLASARMVRRQRIGWLAGALLSLAVVVASIIVLVVADLDWSGIEPAYWFGGAAAGIVGLSVCGGSFFGSHGVRGQWRRAGIHRVVGARSREDLPAGYARATPEWDEWDGLHVVSGQTEPQGWVIEPLTDEMARSLRAISRPTEPQRWASEPMTEEMTRRLRRLD